MASSLSAARFSFLQRFVLAFAFRFACYGVMVWLALWSEARAAPTLPDLVLSVVPYVRWVDEWNYWIWLVAYVPVAVALLFTARERFIRYTVSSGLLALVRGVCIAVTGLGPVNGHDAHVGLAFEERVRAFWQLATPFGFFSADGARLYLTKDLFFSGHTATTFLLLLYVWRYRTLRWVMLATHVLVVASVFLAHLHYTIDVIGAYAVAFSVFVVREGRTGV